MKVSNLLFVDNTSVFCEVSNINWFIKVGLLM